MRVIVYVCVRVRVYVYVCVCVRVRVRVCARSAGKCVTCMVASLPSCFLSHACARKRLSEFLSTQTHTPSALLSLTIALSLSLSLSLPLATQDMRQHIDTTMAVHTHQLITNLPTIIQASLELAVAKR